ncbi:MAG: flavin reductase family protein [Ignavibacterium sp.]|nr:MAG: flavin reductase family protein [Ignavibacterium sp.]
MLHYEPKDLPVRDLHKLLLGGVAPRPIALVSTISQDGIHNLSPFSFFNAFGANPPMIAFSPARRGRDASLKDTYNNLIASNECVVQAVTYSMVEQISLASTEYPPDVDEFAKSGLTPIDSDLVKPKRVKESPFQMECKLVEMRSYGDKGASANMAICEVLKVHIVNDIFTDGIIDPQKIDLVGRMSGDYYCRASGSSIFEIEKPNQKKGIGIGFDLIPDFMKESKVYTANNLAKFAGVEIIPGEKTVTEFINSFSLETMIDRDEGLNEFNHYQKLADYKLMMQTALELSESNYKKSKYLIELTAKCALENNDTDFAWKAALYACRLSH